MYGEGDLQQRVDEAIGEAMYEIAKSMTEEESWEMDRDPMSLSRAYYDRMKERADELATLSREEVAILTRLRSFFGHDRKKGDEVKQALRARDIIQELQMNVNFPILPYGETLLSSSVNHSLEMMQMLIEKGADVNFDNEMGSECAIDQILEEEEKNGGLSDEKKAMKQLLLSKGAKTREERFLELAERARKKRKDRREDEDCDDDDDDDEFEI